MDSFPKSQRWGSDLSNLRQTFVPPTLSMLTQSLAHSLVGSPQNTYKEMRLGENQELKKVKWSQSTQKLMFIVY